MYTDIEKIKDDMVTTVVFGYDPSPENYKKVMKTAAMSRYAFEGCPIECAMLNVPRVLKYLSSEMGRLSSQQLQNEIDRRVFEVFHPKKTLSQSDKERLDAIDRAINALNQCDALNVNVGGRISELQKERCELLGIYYPEWH